MKKVILYGYVTSPFVMKVGCFLKYKQIQFDHVAVNPVRPVQIKFTGQRQVPVLTIDGEWRKDSTPLGIWLDEVFPQRPLLGDSAGDRKRILAIDDWATKHLIPGHFRGAVDWVRVRDSVRNGWRLARVVHDGTPLPRVVRLVWPLAVRKAPFIVRMMETLDRTESYVDMRARHAAELVAHLAGGPFLGGRQTVSLADLSVYPIVVSSHVIGLHGDNALLRRPEILAWSRRVQEHMPDNPLVVPGHLFERALP